MDLKVQKLLPSVKQAVKKVIPGTPASGDKAEAVLQKNPANTSKGNVVFVKKWRFGDRKDGWKLRTLNPLNKFMPYVMPMRCDAQNTYADEINVNELEKYVRRKVKEGKNNFSILHVLLAAYVRTVSQYPAINRFCVGRKIYARNDIQVVMVVKKEMKLDSPSTCIKVWFSPYDTIDDVYRKFDSVVSEIKNHVEEKSDFEKLNRAITLIPDLAIKIFMEAVRKIDEYGLMPQKLTDLSPFHGSMIITSMGSLGIRPIYHHIYNFGTLPVFLSYGTKRYENYIDSEGNVKKRRYVELKAVTDERICEGYYYASAFKMMKKYVEHPMLLEVKPKKVKMDIN